MGEKRTADEMESAAGEALYEQALTEAARIANRSVSAAFEGSRRKTFSEFCEFLQRIGQGLSVENASDMDVIAFIQGDWMPKHQVNCRTRVGEEGEKIASASAVRGVIQHLSKSYAMLGRADWENPAKQESVRNYSDGYRMWLKERSVREKRAKVFKEQKVEDLVRYMETKIERSRGIGRCVLRMDLAAIDYLWESWSRGKECGELRVDQVDFEEGVSLPGWSKTVQSEPSARIELSGEGRGRFLKSAAALIHDLEEQGHDVGQGYLFRPLNKQRDGFEQSALSANALRKRLQQHLKNAGLYEGETLHSFRRSAVQGAAEIEGYDVQKLMSLGRWKSYAAFRIYVEEIASQFPRC